MSLQRNHRFEGIKDPSILSRLLKSQEIRTINRFSFFEAVNQKNGHRYKVEIKGNEIICSYLDSQAHACKHEIAVARDIELFEFMEW